MRRILMQAAATGVIGGIVQYWQKLRSIAQPAGFWPLWDASGTIAVDVSGNGLNGAYKASGITLVQPGIGDGKTCALFSNADINIGKPETKAIIESQEFSIFGLAKISDPAEWNDTNYKDLLYISAGASNNIEIRKYAAANQLYFVYKAGGVDSSILKNPFSPAGWFMWGMTVSKAADKFIPYLNGLPVNAGASGLGAWVPAVTSQTIGGRNATTDYPWPGWIQHVLITSKVLTPAEVAQMSQPFFSLTYGGEDSTIFADGLYNAFPGMVEV